MNKRIIRRIAVLMFVTMLGMSGAVVAAPTTPCTSANFGATEVHGSQLYQCLGTWQVVGFCDQWGRCIYY